MYALAVVTLSTGGEAYGADDRDSKGTDFWVTFLPNLHNSLDQGDQLFLFITSDQAVDGTIEYTNRSGVTNSQPFSITDPSQIYTFSISSLDYELIGYNYNQGNGRTLNHPDSQNGAPAKQVFHITASQDITVYGLNQARLTSDAFLALPTDVLGEEYYVMAYNSDGFARGQNFEPDPQSTPSQFAVIATEDGTTVNIFPTTPIRFTHTTEPIEVSLNRGEAFLVQADITMANLNGDLSGTRISSDKPIGLYAGHQRATLPYDNDILGSRDHLVQQLPPINSWGRNAFVTPFRRPTNNLAVGTDIYRVIAARDNTEIFINGSLTTVLNKGEIYEAPLTAAAHIEASGPIMVAQFKKTANDESSSLVGDPFMMIIPPSEQYLESYRVINAQATEGSPNNRVYTEQVITVIIPSNAAASLNISPPPFQQTPFVPIGVSGYSYAHALVSDGTHTLRADAPFGTLVYGYGNANSYGYVGGNAFEIITDGQAPEITGQRDCGKYQGARIIGSVYDTLETDTRIETVTAPAEELVNVNVDIEDFEPFADSVAFRAALVNPYEDGSFTITATDSVAFERSQSYELPGFTVHVNPQFRAQQVETVDGEIRVIKATCMDFELINYGGYEQTIASLGFALGTPEFTLKNVALPFTLSPGARKTITVCFQSDATGDFIDTLIVGNNCRIRPLIAFHHMARADNDPPALSVFPDRCNKVYDVLFTEILPTDWGIQDLDIVSEINCSVERAPESTSDSTRFFVRVENQRLDAIYSIAVTDSTGANTQIISDTIPGFTLLVQSPAPDPIVHFENFFAGQFGCDTIRFHNFGLRTYRFDNAILERNLEFSAPQWQFPFVIPPGSSGNLIVCFAPIANRDYSDRLIYGANCITDTVQLLGKGAAPIHIANARCNVTIRAATQSIANEFFVEPPAPNPSASVTRVRVGLPEPRDVIITVFDIMGAPQTRIERSFNAGLFDIDIETSRLESGLYFYEVRTNNKRSTGSLSVIR